MTAPHLISIIMVTRDTGESLYPAIASLLKQEEKLELILVNNGNPPDVEETLVEKFKDVPHVRLMTGHGDIGIVKGRNLGARVASGDYLLFIDDTCILPENALTLLHRESQDREDPFLFGARIVDEKGKEKKTSRLALLSPTVGFVSQFGLSSFLPSYKASFANDKMPTKTSLVPAFGSAFVFCAKSVFDSFDGFDETYPMDLAMMDYCLRFSQDGGVINFIPDLVVCQGSGILPAFDMKVEKREVQGYFRYFFENYANSYPQPILWALYSIYGVSFALKVVIKRIRAVL